MSGSTDSVTPASRPRDRPDDPEAELVEGRGVEHEDGARERRRAAPDGPRPRARAGPGSARRGPRRRGRRRATAATAAPSEGERRVAGDRVTRRKRIAADDGERRARVDAEDAGLGQRVARRALHQRAGRPERGADEQPELGARDAQVADDRGRVAAVVGGERADDVGERHRQRAERERGDRADGRQHDRGDEAGAPGAPGRERDDALGARGTRGFRGDRGHGSSTPREGVDAGCSGCPNTPGRAHPSAIPTPSAGVLRDGGAAASRNCRPPSTTIVWPVTNALAGEARYSAVPTMSSGVAARLIAPRSTP